MCECVKNRVYIRTLCVCVCVCVEREISVILFACVLTESNVSSGGDTVTGCGEWSR